MSLNYESFGERPLQGRDVSPPAGGSTGVLFIHLDGLCVELRLIDVIYVGLLVITALVP